MLGLQLTTCHGTELISKSLSWAWPGPGIVNRLRRYTRKKLPSALISLHLLCFSFCENFAFSIYLGIRFCSYNYRIRIIGFFCFVSGVICGLTD